MIARSPSASATRWHRYACPSPISRRLSARSSAVSAAAALVYLASYGARTPLLALRGLLRLRNITLVLAPAVAIGIAARLVEMYLPSAADGAFAVALVPAPLMASEVVTRLRGRMDLAGALVLGTFAFSLLFIGSRSAIAAGGLFAATEAFAIAAMVANAIPMVRDAILVPLRLAGWLAAAVVIAFALIALPVIDASVAVAAVGLFAAGALTAVLAAWLTGRDITAVIAGAGLRDPILAVAFASFSSGPQDAGVALLYGVFCLVLTAVALRTR